MTHHASSPAPSRSRGSRRWLWIGLGLGLAALGGLGIWSGVGQVGSALAAGGPALLLLLILHPLQLVPQSEAWRQVFPPGKWLRFRTALKAMWIGQSVNLLLPTATFGGEVVKARLATLAGLDVAVATASVIVDKTAQAAGVLLVMLIGLILMAVHAADPNLLLGAVLASLAMAGGLLGFVFAQRAGGIVRWLERRGRGQSIIAKAGAGASAVQEQLHAIYARPVRFVGAAILRTVATLLMTLEIWWAADLMGVPISLEAAFTLKVAGFAVRSAAFFVWGGVGVQEAAFAAFGLVYGLSPATLIALSLASRVRETVVGSAGLIVWLLAEARNAVGAESRAIQPPPRTRSPS